MKLDGIELYVGNTSIFVKGEKEDKGTDINVPQYPVESGSPLSDHAQIQEKTIEVNGDLVDDNWDKVFRQMQTLQSWADGYKLVGLRHGYWETDYMVQNLKTSFSIATNSIGVEFTLVKVRFPKSSYTKRKNSGQKKPSASTAVYLTVQPGNTYWGWSMRYGTSIPQLRAWNRYPDRFIPIGVRVRVK